MSDGRRHSVDIPISKTLVALRRVRSLRDPSTNSMSKFSYFFDNMSWETGSCDGLSLQLVNGLQERASDNQSLLRCQKIGSDRSGEEFGSDLELDYSSPKLDSKLISSKKSAQLENKILDLMRTKQVDGSGNSRSNGDEVYRRKSSGERRGGNYRDRALELACAHPSGTHLKDTDDEANIELAQSDRVVPTAIKRKTRCGKRIKSSEAGDVVRSHVSSPCLSISDVPISSRSPSLFENEDDAINRYHRGCGISCCWSRTPKFSETNLPSDVGEYPLLSGEGGEMSQSGQEGNCPYAKSKLGRYSDGPRSLSQKFRPRSFHELVGQHVVARSLVSAITSGRVTSFYLFHGPHGTGKTSTSRIFAAALNCLSFEEHRPCGLCRECMLFFSGRCRDVKEVDPARTNRIDRLRSLLRNAALPPVSSRFKVLIIDECQFLEGETWATILNSLEGLPQHVVFVMITADLEKLPRSAMSRCQKYHFPKIKEADIASRLANICGAEGLDFDKVALDFIAAKSNGSLRDAEMMLDQLSLLGKRITVSLAYELIGIVSDDDLLDLLDLALSSDTSNTVRSARELMRSRIDPMQLISQLANLIMDILAGRCQTGSSEVGRKFFRKHTSEADIQKLRNALKILSETEKQLRTSKNQTTWLTVALLQFNSVESGSLDPNDSRACLRKAPQNDGGFRSISAMGENLNNSISCLCDDNKSQNSEIHRHRKENLEAIWKTAIERCQSNTLKRFLQKEGKLCSLCFNQGLAVAVVEFCHPDHVFRAEKSWKLIATSLQLVLGCNVEIRISLAPCASATKNTKFKKPTFSLLPCSCGRQGDSHSTTEDGNEQSDNSDFTSESIIRTEKPVGIYSCDCGSQYSTISSHFKETATSIKNSEGNPLNTGTTTSHSSAHDDPPNGSQLIVDSSREVVSNRESQVFAIEEPEDQPSCFSRLHRSLCSPDASQTISLRIQTPNKLELAIPQTTSCETYSRTNDPYILCSSSNTNNNTSADEERSRLKESGANSKAHCWSAPRFPPRKAWQLRQQRQGSQLMGWVPPCATAK